MPIIKSTVRAAVRWFSDRQGYGFLRAEGDIFDQEFFVHYSAIEVDARTPRRRNRPYRSLSEMQEVEILEYIKRRDGRLKATRVRKL